jgi:hypothetical protein
LWVTSTESAIGDNFSAGAWHALLVAFDDEGVVLQKDFASLSHRSSPDEHLER